MRLIAIAVFASLTLKAQVTLTPTDDHAEVALQAAIRTEIVDGDLKSAIQQYEAITRSGNRAAAAQALVKMGGCYEKLGSSQAAGAYQRVIREFSDQKDALAEARRNLATLANKSGGIDASTATAIGKSPADAGNLPPVGGQIGWYNGDRCYCAQGLRNQAFNDQNRAMVYDDFAVPLDGWTVIGVFSNNYMNHAVVSQAYWEIRKGMSAGNGGEVVASGTSPATLRPRTPVDSSGYADYDVRVDGLSVKLEPGRYWLAVAPFAPGYSYINATIGKNAAGTPRGNNGDCYFDYPGKPRFMKSGNMGGGVHDSSLGVRIAGIAAH